MLKIDGTEYVMRYVFGFRSDMIHPAGPFFLKDLLLILPMIDPVVLLELTGAQIVATLENGVSKWPALEGRFPQVRLLFFYPLCLLKQL